MIIWILIELFQFLYGVGETSIETKGMFCVFSTLESLFEIVILIFYLKERFSI
jgi:hypothetical protein